MKEKLIQFANRSKLEEFLALHKKRFLERKEYDAEIVYNVTFDDILEKLITNILVLEAREYVIFELDDEACTTSVLPFYLSESQGNILIVDFF
ncbi:TPA: hypothetical protein OUF62_002902 [Listeria monocytogenes]|nr:hypothetical protein [Listeria monocytogenes]EHC6210330.1 hypothetical protein [Listeria monocytogenes serotype 1/2b]HCU0633133.1 hypothetical protein [Listeria monocytogenes]HCU0634939.1 hypothetical protein [Listeria monocytogenes]